MSRFFPHSPYAEDQSLAHTIMYTHTLTRGFQAGSVVGAGISLPIYAFSRSRWSKSTAPKSFITLLSKSAGRGALAGTALLAIGTTGRLWGKGEIEWQDRSWRLMENKGQLETDDWTYVAMGLAGISAAALRQTPRIAIGSVGLGSVAGLLGYMGWRYGLHGGKF